MIVVSIVFLIAVAMFCWERRHPGRTFAAVRGWWWRAALLNGMQVAIVFVAGAAWDGWMLDHRPWNGDALGPVGGALVGYLAITFVYYWWHRWRHTVPVLWRVFHQIHHSASRIEILTSFYKHPVEVLATGRFVVAECGSLYTTVTARKTTRRHTFIGTDTGFNHLLRPALYDSYHPIRNLSAPDAPIEQVTVAGNICESGDLFARDRALPHCSEGDLLAIDLAGAYGASMASTYNLRERPAEVMVSGSIHRLIRRRDTLDDLLAAYV